MPSEGRVSKWSPPSKATVRSTQLSSKDPLAETEPFELVEVSLVNEDKLVKTVMRTLVSLPFPLESHCRRLAQPS